MTSAKLAVAYVPVADLHTYHRNPRHGDTKKIAQSLQVNGQYKPLVVNTGTHTGRPDEVLAGNHTLIAARDLGWDTVAVVYRDVDDDHAARIVLADNRTADVATYDDRLLAELIGDLPDVDGTGYDPGDLDDLVAGLQESLTMINGDDPSGMRQTNALEDNGQAYADTDTRSIILAYPLADFEVMVLALADLADRYGVESNAAVVQHLVQRATANP